MAKLIFKNTNEIPLHHGSLVGAGSTDQDLSYIHHGAEHLYSMFDITQAEYDGLFNDTKKLTIVDNLPSVVDEDPIEDHMMESEETYMLYLNQFKLGLQRKMDKRPNHSKISDAQDTLNFINNIDTSALTYPTKSIQDVLRENNKYIDLRYF
tara:strand:- start:517 stop:972 length:456 start_codon:yes stop_codon:yes gene_type:complete